MRVFIVMKNKIVFMQMVRLLFLYNITWLNPEAGNIKRILCSDWLPGRARWAALVPPFSVSLFLAKLVQSRLLNIGLPKS